MKKTIIVALLVALIAPAVAFAASPVDVDVVGSIQYFGDFTKKPELKTIYKSLEYGVAVKADVACFQGTAKVGVAVAETKGEKFYTAVNPTFDYTLGLKTEVGPVRLASGIGQKYQPTWDGTKLTKVSIKTSPIFERLSIEAEISNIVFGVSADFDTGFTFENIKSGANAAKVLYVIKNPTIGITCGYSF